MRHFLLARLAALVVVLIMLSVIIFAVQSVIPGDPVRAMVGSGASKQVVAETRASLGLDDPLPARYVHFLDRLAHGDLGTSLRTRRPVLEDVASFLPATLELAGVAMLFAALLGTVFGIALAARLPGSAILRIGMLAASSAPVFLVAIVLLLLLYASLGWLPANGRTDDGGPGPGPTGFLLIDSVIHLRPGLLLDAARHLVLPAVALSLGPAVAIGRSLRSSLETVMRQDYFRTALAKGLSPTRALLRHGLRNAAGPALAMAGLQFGVLLTGVVLVEAIFAWPGIGNYTAAALARGDFPAITGVTLVLGAAFVVINAVVDVLQAAADPRIRTT